MDSKVLLVATAGRLPRIEATGGIAGRHTEIHTVHLVSAAATPLGGDSITLRVVVEPGARLRLRSSAATIALPGRIGVQSWSRLELDVAGDLDVDLEPTVVAAEAAHHAGVTANLDAAGTLRLRERVQIGRAGERGGFWSGTLHADLKGVPMLRHRIELGAGSVADDVLSAPRAVVSELSYPGTAPPAPAPGAVALELATGGVLTTWLGERLPVAGQPG